MKLKNLMYATMIACAFSSCSKDEIVDPGVGPDAEANASLEVRIANAETKALPNGTLAQEDAIRSLQLLVFNGTSDDAVLEAIGTVNGDGGAMTVKTAIKPGNKKVIVLANVDVAKTTPVIAAGTTTFTALKSVIQSFAQEKVGENSQLSMNSKVYNISVAESNTTYMGYVNNTGNVAGAVYLEESKPIKLYRNVAKIKLNSITTEIPADQYPNAKLTLKKVFVLHAHSNTNIIGAEGAEWGAINQAGNYLIGETVATYKDTWVAYMTKTINGKPLAPVYPFINTEIPYSQEESYSQVLTGSALTVADNKLLPFYTYENTEAVDKYRTLLVVQADFTYKKLENGQLVEYTAKDRYYPLAVGYNATGDGNTTDFTGVPFANLRGGVASLAGVLRNVGYVVSLKITGIGYETPFGPKPDGGGTGEGGDTFLDAKVEVVGFGAVGQSGTIE